MREHCEPSLESYPRIREYFKNKTVFVTGGSGFIGVVLIEKLLRSCPGIKHMYVLLRPKKGLTTKERGDKIFYPEVSEAVNLLQQETQLKLIFLLVVQQVGNGNQRRLEEEDYYHRWRCHEVKSG